MRPLPNFPEFPPAFLYVPCRSAFFAPTPRAPFPFDPIPLIFIGTFQDLTWFAPDPSTSPDDGTASPFSGFLFAVPSLSSNLPASTFPHYILLSTPLILKLFLS